MLIISSDSDSFILRIFYFCKLLHKRMNMKKVIFAVVVCMSLIFSGCKEELVTSKYTIGCLGYQTGSTQGSDWQAIEAYFKSTVDYNRILVFEGHTQAENDAQAVARYEEQKAKLDNDNVCSKLKGDDYFIYGIYTLKVDGSQRRLGAIKFTKSGVEEEYIGE